MMEALQDIRKAQKVKPIQTYKQTSGSDIPRQEEIGLLDYISAIIKGMKTLNHARTETIERLAEAHNRSGHTEMSAHGGCRKVAERSRSKVSGVNV